jgi:hypothetical protein
MEKIMTVILVHDDDDAAAATLADDCVYVCAGVIVGIIITSLQLSNYTISYALIICVSRRIAHFK